VAGLRFRGYRGLARRLEHDDTAWRDHRRALLDRENT
jgi:hypothetical protein